MSEAGAYEASHANNTNTHDAPFEWLTNFRSFRHLIMPSRIVDCSSFSPCSKGDDSSDTSTSPTSEQPTVKLNALHIGCGTSTAGESLLRLRERPPGYPLLRYGHVVNLDNDERALDTMQRRWSDRKKHQLENQTDKYGEVGTMTWKCLDFKSDASCRLALDGVYRQLMQQQNSSASTETEPGGCFDLVLDKSTLDCLLCSETILVAQFMCEIYRALRVPISSPSDQHDAATNSSTLPLSWGGVYFLVTFQPAEFVERLLTQIPGADWHVEHQVIKREMEDVNEKKICEVDESTYEVSSSNTCSEEDTLRLTSSAWSSGTFCPDESYHRTVNVFSCRRQCCTQSQSLGTETSLQTSYILDREQVHRHIERTCDEWYRTTNPMVTIEREQQLRAAFSEATVAKASLVGHGEGRRESMWDDVVLNLKQCYSILFTDVEKDHLSYEHFLEDWDAYCGKYQNNGDHVFQRGGMTVTIALDFLKEMQ